jgi:nucleotide-binding universal stress UspA family protein
MMGDDWLNNAATRDRYAEYLETELGREVETLSSRLAAEARARDVRYEHRSVVGDPAECLVAYAAEIEAELIVIGTRRPRGAPGLRSRMDLEKLTGGLVAPLLVAPYPR